MFCKAFQTCEDQPCKIREYLCLEVCVEQRGKRKRLLVSVLYDELSRERRASQRDNERQFKVFPFVRHM